MIRIVYQVVCSGCAHEGAIRETAEEAKQAAIKLRWRQDDGRDLCLACRDNERVERRNLQARTGKIE